MCVCLCVSDCLALLKTFNARLIFTPTVSIAQVVINLFNPGIQIGLHAAYVECVHVSVVQSANNQLLFVQQMFIHNSAIKSVIQ